MGMKLLVSLLVGSLWCAGAMAQTGSEFGGVSAELVLQHDQYIPAEEVRIGVRILNRSGQELSLGKDNHWLRFNIECKDNRIIRQTALPAVAGEFSVTNAMQAVKWVAITPAFDLRQPGRYSISAVLEIPGWNQTIKSETKTFDVELGTQIRELEFGLPPAPGGQGKAPEVRHYILDQVDHRGHLGLYLTITDAENRPETAFRLCDLLTFSRPELTVDQRANAHVISQTGAKQFTYYQINPVGVVLARQTYQYTTTRPTLSLNKTGEVFVYGGERLIVKTDLPPPELPEYNVPDAPSTSP